MEQNKTDRQSRRSIAIISRSKSVFMQLRQLTLLPKQTAILQEKIANWSTLGVRLSWVKLHKAIDQSHLERLKERIDSYGETEIQE